MDIALEEAAKAAEAGEVPVGAVIVDPSGKVIARAHNRVKSPPDPTGHAEMIAIREAAKLSGNERLDGFDLYVTLEPCTMCAQAIAFARIRRVYFGAEDPKGGGITTGARVYNQATCHHRPEVYSGIAEGRSAALLRDFFARRR